jgi:hypothetical protein
MHQPIVPLSNETELGSAEPVFKLAVTLTAGLTRVLIDITAAKPKAFRSVFKVRTYCWEASTSTIDSGIAEIVSPAIRRPAAPVLILAQKHRSEGS